MSSMLTQQINPPPSSNEQTLSQLQPQIQPQPQSFAPSSTFQYTQSVQVRPLPNQVQQSSQSVQNLTSGQFGITSSMNRSAFASVRGSKYNNKYSFKRHGAADKPKLMSTSINQVQQSGMIGVQESLANEVNYWRSIAQQQENALVRIREFAFNRRRSIVDSSALGLESIRHANSLSEIYNLSLLNGKIQPLEFLAENQQVIQTVQPIIQNGQQVVVNGNASVARQQKVVVNYELNQRSNSQVVTNNISVSNNRPVVFIQQANQSVRAPVSGQSGQQFQFQESTSFVPAPVPVPVQVPVNVSSTTTTVTAQRTNIPTQYVQVAQSPRPQSTNINPEASSKPQKNDFSIPSYTPYEQSFKPYEVPTYKSNETSYKPYEFASYSQAPLPTSKPQSFYFTRETQQYTLPNQNTLNINTNSELYTVQIRELRNKVQILQQQKSALIDKIRLIQKNNFSSSNSQETIQVYRDEINQLKIQIAELTDLYNSGSGRQHNQTEVTELRKSILILSETNKQYEEQLIQAQNHIIYLQNSRNADENTLHLQEQVKYLRETIAKYTEHVQQLDIERQKYNELLQQRQNEVQHYLQEVNQSRAYIQTLEGHIQKTKHAVQGNGVSYDTYNQLIAQYGKKQLQVIILMEEINRLNYRYNELQAHLEKAEEYIIHIQETSGTAVNGNQLGLLREQYEAELARAAEEKNTLNLTIQKLQNTIEQSVNIERTTKVSSSLPSNLENSEESLLREELARKHEEARLLSQELTTLNSKYSELKDHLQRAEDYIIHLQEIQQAGSPVNTLVAPDTDRQKLEEELNSLQLKLGQYQSQLLQERREREIMQNRSQLFSAEYEDMELRYKNALESLNKRYDQLLQERNSITARLSEAEDRLIAQASTANRENISHLNTSVQSLDAQLRETKEHLQRAEEYIQNNMRLWEEANGYKERHDQQLTFIQQLHQDLDNTKRQNQEFAGRLEHFDNLVGEIERLRSENEKLTIVVHSKDNAGNATSLKQIDQTQESLENYTRLYQQSQARVSTLRAELESLNHQLLAKQSQLDQTVHRSLQTEDHLRRAEEHILFMEQQLTSSQTAIQQLQTALRAETAKSSELVEALKHAEDHIYHIQQQINRK